MTLAVVAAEEQPVSMLRVTYRMTAFLLMTLVLLVPYLAVMPFSRTAKTAIAQLWCRGCCALTGLDVKVTGQPAERRPAIIAANHVSYLDVPILAACTDGTFVAKREVADWPLFGFLAKLARTVFVDRRPRAVRGQIDDLVMRLRRSESIVFFPEGTSSDGSCVKPFKSALFKIAYPGFPCPTPVVQPVSITYGLQAVSPYAWYGEMTFLSHLISVFGRPGSVVHVHFDEPVRPSAFASRKELAQHCHAAVLRGLGPAWATAAIEQQVEQQNSAEDQTPVIAAV